MSGRHRSDFPEGTPDEGGHDPEKPVFGPANDGSSEWFTPRDGQSSPLTGGSGETPQWFQPPPEEPPGYGAGGFSGASDAGGYGLGRSSGYGSPGGTGGYERPSRASGGYERPSQASGSLPTGGTSSTGYGGYESVSRSDERGFFGGRPGGPGGGGSGPYRSGGHPEEPARRRRRRRGALIGPLAGAIGLVVLLGAGVYAFTGFGGGCEGDGALVLNVAAAPDIAPAVTKSAERFNGKEHTVGGSCVRADVTATDPSAVSTLLSGQGVPSDGSKRPDVWIPDSSLWTSLVRGSDKGRDAIQVTRTSVASSPIVVGLPQTLATQLQRQGVTAAPSWDNLLKAAGGTAGGGVTKNQMIPPGAVRLLVPEPATNASGMGSLMITNALLTNDPNKESIFTGIVRTVREATVRSVDEQFKQFRKGRAGRQPVALAPEQALWKYNRTSPQEPAVALYPLEGTLSMDYPVVVAAQGEKARAAALLESALGSADTRKDVQALGFRAPDGRAPTGFSQKFGVNPSRPRQLPTPKAAEIGDVMQAWSKLSLGLRMLVLTDVSGSMAEEVSPGTTRMQAIAKVSQGGLSMMSNDTEIGEWVFATNMDGSRPYREAVQMGELGERIGSGTRRDQMLAFLSQLRPKPDGDTAIYETMLAAYQHMSRTYKPEFGNSILLLTDGRNDHPGSSLTLARTLQRLKEMKDPNKPVQVNMIGFGKGVDASELEQIAQVTDGNVQVAQTPQEIQKIFLKMLSRRISD